MSPASPDRSRRRLLGLLAGSGALLFAPDAPAYPVELDFDCCRAPRAPRWTLEHMTIACVPFADLRPNVVANFEKAEPRSHAVGHFSGYFWKPTFFDLVRPVRDYLTEGFSKELERYGHTSFVVSDFAPAPGQPALAPESVARIPTAQAVDYFLHGEVREFDIYYDEDENKYEIDIALFLIRPQSKDPVWKGNLTLYETVEAEQKGPKRQRSWRELKKIAKEIHGSGSKEAVVATSIELSVSHVLARWLRINPDPLLLALLRIS